MLMISLNRSSFDSFCSFFVLLFIFQSMTSCQSGSAEKAAEAPPKKNYDFVLKAQGDDMSQLKYSPDRLEVTEGSKVVITLINESKDSTMLHNFVLVPFGAENKVGMAAAKAGKKYGYVPRMDEVLAASEMLKPGQKTRFRFTAPAKGNYRYICTFPGHFVIMQGLFVVK